jgi:hypothetical protein
MIYKTKVCPECNTQWTGPGYTAQSMPVFCSSKCLVKNDTLEYWRDRAESAESEAARLAEEVGRLEGEIEMKDSNDDRSDGTPPADCTWGAACPGFMNCSNDVRDVFCPDTASTQPPEPAPVDPGCEGCADVECDLQYKRCSTWGERGMCYQPSEPEAEPEGDLLERAIESDGRLTDICLKLQSRVIKLERRLRAPAS